MKNCDFTTAFATGAAVVGAVGAFVFWPNSKSKLR